MIVPFKSYSLICISLIASATVQFASAFSPTTYTSATSLKPTTLLSATHEHDPNDFIIGVGGTTNGPDNRRAFVTSVSLALAGLALSPLLTKRAAWTASATESFAVDYNAVARDIRFIIEHSRDDPQNWGPTGKSVGPTLIRLAWHSSGTYARVPPSHPPVGGSGNGTMRFRQEQAHYENAGLTQTAIQWMKNIHDKHPGISYGDLYTLGGVVAVKTLGGPTIEWGYGRVDTDDTNLIPPEGRLPKPATPAGSPASTLDAAQLRTIFGRMGFNDQEIVALSGAHAVGRCHRGFSGYDGPWQLNEDQFNNSYFRLLNLPTFLWVPRRIWFGGPVQYRLIFAGNRIMMLPTDISLSRDREFRKYVRKYARSQDDFFVDFAKTFSKLLALGTENLTPYELDF